ncbi:fructosamine kinase [Actinomyces sp. 2119]|uniref:Fructosamine kinase n=1 Tax=Actinomyces lilanjuaniae TaxID=2321394 RepID=A0ABM6Z114_9ACTO|nr:MULTISPECIES: fructosamine kinase family protein [Actinomyces]AYD88929.1 fructosamine kinase [Actinomyces lilanjuaniae]RJF41234.1 fructosamine kinase [Actinomyces sp. 2119]
MTAPSPSTFRKHDDGPVSTLLEAQGLWWLAQAMADGGAHVVPATTGPGWLEEPRLATTRVTASAAEAFGRALAVTHAAGAPAFGAAPPDWDGVAQMGRSDIRLRRFEDPGAQRRWGEFYAEDRVLAYLGASRDNGSISTQGARVIERLCARLVDGDFDADQPGLVRAGAQQRSQEVAVARTHGDLWCGNVLWVPVSHTLGWAPPEAGVGPLGAGTGRASTRRDTDGEVPDVVGVLIDPMAQGAHAETDLAALGVFGQRHLERIYAAYHEVSPLAAGWRERVGLHSLHLLMIHAFLFGGSYGAEAVGVARQYV